MKIVLCRGVFDLLHVAHLRHLEEAKTFGDRLVVSLTTDEAAEREKRRPIIPEKERMEMLRGLRCVFDVSLCSDPLRDLQQWKPQIFCKGYDCIANGLPLAVTDYCAEHGIEIVYTSPNPQTTSGIIKRIRCLTLPSA